MNPCFPLPCAAERGYPLAQLNLAGMYLDGHPGIPRDPKTAAAWLRKAADKGFGPAEHNLAMLLSCGDTGLPADPAEALKLVKRALEHGAGYAASLVARLRPSSADAAVELKRAAQGGDPGACFTLAQAYHDGLMGLQRCAQGSSRV